VKPSTGRIVQASRPAGASVHGALAGGLRRSGSQWRVYRLIRTCAVLWEVLDSMVIGGRGASSWW
jgi:hypothetical protein